MSRVRIHGMMALNKYAVVKIWGKNWEYYDNEKTVQENLDFVNEKPDVIVCYKPLQYKGFSKLECLKVLRYNEMYELELTIKEIEESNADVVICHHENDCKFYKHFYECYFGQKNNKVKLYHIPHFANKTIFKDYKLNKEYDVLLVGRCRSKNRLVQQHYPIRDRMYDLIHKLDEKYKVGVYNHPGYIHQDSFTDKYLIEFAKEINKAKICVTCSGRPKSRFGKYIEIPMCGSVIIADIPKEDEENIRKFVIEIDMDMTDDEILNKLTYYLENKEAYENLKEEGFKWSKNHRDKNYALQFLKIIEENL